MDNTEPNLIFDGLASPELEKFIINQIDSHNFAVTGRSDWAPINFFLRDRRGEFIGGLLAYIWGDWLHVRFLWVAPHWRRQGQGLRLLCAAEEMARERHCISATLETFSFQAPEFYRKHGYAVVGTLSDYPPGHSKYFLRKYLLCPVVGS